MQAVHRCRWLHAATYALLLMLGCTSVSQATEPPIPAATETLVADVSVTADPAADQGSASSADDARTRAAERRQQRAAEEGDWLGGLRNGLFYEHSFDAGLGVEIGQFINSGRIQSRLVGVVWQPLHFRDLRFGLVAGALSGYMQLHNGHYAPAALPELSFITHRFKVNAFCIPAIVANQQATCAMQFGVNIKS